MASSKRIQKELSDIKKSDNKTFQDLQVNEKNQLQWTGLLVPQQPPYNAGAFKVQLEFPTEYPFKPPTVSFLTKIYHPNIDESGKVCLTIIAPETWKPATKTEKIIEALVAMIHTPEPDHPLRADLAQEYVTDKAKFLKAAEEFTAKNSEKRPN